MTSSDPADWSAAELLAACRHRTLPPRGGGGPRRARSHRHVRPALVHAGGLDAVEDAQEQLALVDLGLRAVAEQGARWNAFDYLQAMSDRANYGVATSLFLDRFDLLVTSTLPIPAFPAGQLVADPATQTRWTDWTPFTYPFNLTQQPAASLPVGLTAAGLPVGLQVVAGKHRDALVLRAARALEGAFPFRVPAPGPRAA